MVVSGWNKNRHVPEGILNPFENKLNEKYMQHGSPRCYTMRCAKIPSTARKLPQKHRRLKYSMLPIPNWPGSIFISNRKWLRHTNNTTHNIHTRPFCARCGPYSLRCAKTTATTLNSQHCQPVDKLPIEKTGEAPVWCLHTLIWLSSGVQSFVTLRKCIAATVNKFWRSDEQYKRWPFCLNFRLGSINNIQLPVWKQSARQ